MLPQVGQTLIVFVGFLFYLLSACPHAEPPPVAPVPATFQNGKCDPNLEYCPCPAGSTRNAQGKCVAILKACPAGFTRNAQGKCVRVVAKACPAGTRRSEDGDCEKICSSGTRLNSKGVCEKVCPTGTRITSQGDCEIVCPTGTRKNNRGGCDPLTAREIVQLAMKDRPTDPWPTGKRHVLLGIPGSPEKEKGYLEPGGSFSPGVDSFGMSFWLLNAKGEVVASSDTIEQNQTNATYSWQGLGSKYPGIKVSYPFKYDVIWTPIGLGKWQLDFKSTAESAAKFLFVVRSVGPAGGEVKSLKWDGSVLQVNNRWKINFDQVVKDSNIRIGHEEKNTLDWKKTILTEKDREFKDGWGFATVDISSTPNWKIEITDGAASSVPAFAYEKLKANLDIDIGSAEFNESVNAQVAHLMMGLTRKEAWAGDPFSFNKKRSREAAYTIVALARAGQIEVAKVLLTDFLDKYTWGSSDTDTPGLFLWAAEEIAAKLIYREPDNSYAFRLWPQILQKADELMRSNIIHSAPQQQAIFYVQALNYRGLLSAADYAERFKKIDEANRWRKRAEEWKQAWSADFKAQISHEAPYLGGLWPSGIAAATRDTFVQGLESRWALWRSASTSNAPTQNSFELAAAHQWLMLDNADRTRNILSWYWDNQAMRGLYFWRNTNETNLGTNWDTVRGWVAPPNNTAMPHYWTAAEMLLLQLDMLGYIDDSGRDPVLVIGAGIRPDLVDKWLNVNGMLTNFGEISWEWNPKDKRVTIFVADKQARDKLNRNKDRMLRVGAAIRAVMKGKPEIRQR